MTCQCRYGNVQMGGFGKVSSKCDTKREEKIAIFIMRWGETVYDLPFPLN